jgi:nucleotide-binding universal stress UspA family protein
MTGSRPVLVGYADDAAGDAALRVAMQEAELRHTSLTIFHQLVGTEVPDRYQQTPPTLDGHRAAVDGLVRKANEVVPGFEDVDVRVVTDAIAEALVFSSSAAALVVVGVTSNHAATAAAFDTVPRELVRRSRCPVLLVPPGGDVWMGAQIVCGIDRSESSASALRWAAQEADRRGVIVHAVELLKKKPTRLLDAGDRNSLQSWVRDNVPLASTFVVCTTEVAHAGHRLLEFAEHAHGLLVIGAHEKSSWRKLSVARTVTAQTRVQVAVVPASYGAALPTLNVADQVFDDSTRPAATVLAG